MQVKNKSVWWIGFGERPEAVRGKSDSVPLFFRHCYQAGDMAELRISANGCFDQKVDICFA
jgi:hypothetical protein